MQQWCVCKYDPVHRDTFGRYLKDEWTSVSDIGSTFEDGLLTRESYIEVEHRYLALVEALMNRLGVPHMMGRHLSRYRFQSQLDSEPPTKRSNKDVLDPPETIRMVRDLLRENYWCRLVYKRRLWIAPGYDFYLHFACDELRLDELKQLAGAGLDIQPWTWLEQIRD